MKTYTASEFNRLEVMSDILELAKEHALVDLLDLFNDESFMAVFKAEDIINVIEKELK